MHMQVIVETHPGIAGMHDGLSLHHGRTNDSGRCHAAGFERIAYAALFAVAVHGKGCGGLPLDVFVMIGDRGVVTDDDEIPTRFGPSPPGTHVGRRLGIGAVDLGTVRLDVVFDPIEEIHHGSAAGGEDLLPEIMGEIVGIDLGQPIETHMAEHALVGLADKNGGVLGIRELIGRCIPRWIPVKFFTLRRVGGAFGI